MAPAGEVLQHRLEPRLVVPSLMKGFKNVDELGLGEPVKSSDDGVELVDHVLLFDWVERAVLDADRARPIAEAFVRRGEPTGEGDNARPKTIGARRARNGKGIEKKIGQIDFDIPSRKPVQWN